MKITASAEFAAPVDLVRAQSNDMEHHISRNVHRKLNLNSLSSTDGALEYYQEIRVLGFVMRDKIRHRTLADGSICLSYSGGISNGAELIIKLDSLGESRTAVHQTYTLPLSGLKIMLAPLIRPILKRALYQALEEDRVDIEVRGYPR